MFLLLAIISTIMIVFQLPSFNEWMEWEHEPILSGQVWRIVTGNFTHTNIYHLVMNLFGLWIICFIFRSELRMKQFFYLLLSLSFSVGVFLLFTPMQIYMGLSGVLHGLFAYYAIIEFRNGKKNSLWLIVGIFIKTAWEQLFGSPTGTETLIKATVAINAHLFGVISGVFFGFISNRPSGIKSAQKK